MTAGIQTLAISAAQYVFWAKKNGAYPFGATGTIANGGNAGMARHLGVASLAITIPEASSTPIQGDGGVLGSFKGRPVDPITGSIVFSVMDLVFEATAEGRKLYTDNQFSASVMSETCVNYADLCMVINAKAQSMATGSLGESGYWVYELWDVEAQSIPSELSGTAYDAVPSTYNLTLESVDTEITGLPVSSTNYGVKRGYLKKYWSENPVHIVTHVGDGADVTATLDLVPAAETAAKFTVVQNGVLKAYTTDYTVSGQTLTFVAAPTAGVRSVIRYEFSDAC